MHEFVYVGSDSRGESVTGAISARSLAEAVQSLEALGVVVQSIQLQANTERKKNIGNEEFLERIDSAMAQSESLRSIVETMASEMPELKRSSAYAEITELLSNKPSARQIVSHAKYASWLPLLLEHKRNENDTVEFQRYFQPFVERSRKRSRFFLIVVYPLLLVWFALSIIALISVYLVPDFKIMSLEFQWRVPAPTELLFEVSDFFNAYPVIGTVSLIVTFFGVIALARFFSTIISYLQTWRAIGFLTAGGSSNVAAMHRFTKTLYELIHVNAPLGDALQISGVACQSPLFKKAANNLAREVKSSTRPLSQMSSARSFPASLVWALDGNGSGIPNVAVIRSLSEIYYDRSQQRASNLPSIVSPIAIVLVGIVVGMVVIALFSPLFSLLVSLSS